MCDNEEIDELFSFGARRLSSCRWRLIRRQTRKRAIVIQQIFSLYSKALGDFEYGMEFDVI